MPKATPHSDYHWKLFAAMMQEGIDKTFLQYGMSQQDLEVLEEVAQQADLQSQVIKKILGEYQRKKATTDDVSQVQIVQLMEGVLLSES